MSLFCMNYVDEKDAPIQSPISSSRKPAERLRLEKEEQRNECALAFLIKKVGASDIKLAPTCNSETL